MGNNSDFLADLLRINGLLQASLTELRYRCEVYRLSLRSICKVLGNVQKDHELRLCGLTTSRYSYQTYLQNLSQRQALDRIKNVVRKASTFINGYSLVDKELFQPPPPQPKPMNHEKRITTQTTAYNSTFALTQSDLDSKSPPVSISSNGTSASSEIHENKADASFCKLNKGEVVGKCHVREKHDKKRGSSKRSKSREREYTNLKAATKPKNSTERDEPLAKKQIMSLSVSQQRIQLYNPRHLQNDIRKKLSQQQNYYSFSAKCQSQNHRRKSYLAHDSKSLRSETRRERPSLERPRPTYVENQQEDDYMKKGVRAAHLKEIHESCGKRIHYQVKRENFGTRSSHTYTTQGQGIARKYLFSSHKSHNNLKLSFVAEKVRRIQVCKASGSSYESRQTTRMGLMK